MLVVWPEGQQRSGRLGATIASRNRYGAYLRAGTIPVNPSTDPQVLVRGMIASIQLAWNTILTQDQRDAWNLYGANVTWKNKLGQDVNLPGPQMYIRTNVPNLLAGGTRIDDAPIIFDIAAPELSLDCTASEALQDLAVDFDDGKAWVNEDGAFQLIYMGTPVNAGKKFFGGPYRFVDAIAGDAITPPTTPHTVASSSLIYPYADGQRIWLRTRILRADGRLSEFAQVNFLAVA